MNIDQEREIKKRLSDSKERRDAFVSAYVDEIIPFQIRAMREQQDRRWTQEDLALRTGMKQEAISRFENPNYGKYSLRILKQFAAAFDVALMIRFIPFSEIAKWKLNLSSKSLEVPSFEQEDYFKEKASENNLGVELLKEYYSGDAAKQPKKEEHRGGDDGVRESGVITKFIDYKKRQLEFSQELSMPVLRRISEAINEIAVG